jgi:alpha-L-fucosidase
MALNRRDLLKALGGACSVHALSKYVKAQAKTFVGTRASLQSYQIPEWFRDAKFGIWSHWGPQSAIEDGDWSARNMYMQGSDQYRYHCETYGHPSKVGYKDLVDDWKAAKWDPEHLMSLYKKLESDKFSGPFSLDFA